VDNLEDLISISRFAGERFDLVQAGGGNTSQRVGTEKLYVKASGLALSAVSQPDHFCCVDWQPLVDFLDRTDPRTDIQSLDQKANQAIAAVMQASQRKPSIETLLHCSLGPLTLHTHPVAAAAYLCRQDWQESISAFFGQALLVEYKTPGPALALALHAQLKKSGWQAGDTVSIFLQNHGLIVSAGSKEKIIDTTNDIVDRLGTTLTVDLQKYKQVNFISALVNKVCGSTWLAYLSDDQIINSCASEDQNRLLSAPLTPDQLVYCGPAGLLLDNQNRNQALLEEAVINYFQAVKHPPRVIVLQNKDRRHVFLLGQSLQKCRESEEVLKSIILLQRCGLQSAIQTLSRDEVDYLSNWEAEKYRQTL